MYWRKVVNLKRELRKARHVMIFGAGGEGKELLKKLRSIGIEPAYYVDNNAKLYQSRISGLRVYPVDQLQRLRQENDLVCIASDWAKDIALQLNRHGMRNYLDFTHWFSGRGDWLTPALIRKEKEKIKKAINLFVDEVSRKLFSNVLEYRFSRDPLKVMASAYPQYFHPQVLPEENDTIYDIGAWHGDTAIAFSDFVSGKARIVAFEIDNSNFEELKKNTYSYMNVFPTKIGVWSKETLLKINNDYESSMMYVLGKSGKQKVITRTLDWFVQTTGLIPDLIKMDIEGTEIEALKGAEKLITKVSPKLQIAIYDGAKSLWEIPLLIKKFNPNYRLYLGHHSQSITDTVLYAKV